uniref:Uncharacterized protein n=1 Tax=Leptobrachium leishanense TaxID=445787 RepID=A0A8C5Q084_9ANUR
IRRGPILVLAAGRPSSYFLFLWYGFLLPPVLRRLCQLSLEIPILRRWYGGGGADRTQVTPGGTL